MKNWLASLLSILIFTNTVQSQENWPRTLNGHNGSSITIYQPQHEKLEGNIVNGRAAISIKMKPGDEPLFGVLWYTAVMQTDRNSRMAVLQSIKINEVKIPDWKDESKITQLKAHLEKEVPKWNLKTTLDDIATAVEQEHQSEPENFKNDPPKIIYTQSPSILVLIDGEPKLEQDDQLKMKRVINTAFLVLNYPVDKLYYLYGGDKWYSSASVLSGWKPVSKLPADLQKIDKQLKDQSKSSSTVTSEVSEIIISKEPAELIQSKGEASFASISGTDLLYISNTDDHIFKHISNKQYYVLLSGRWFVATALNGPWKYIASEQLPKDFAHIPKGSEKDVVLASVAGTDQAHDAVIDAQIPQTAKVSRDSATCTVKYNGKPEFEKIEGTNLYVAKNTSSTVLKSGKDYYCVENGIWFTSPNAEGPWKVSDERPKEVEKIPANSQAYNVKYVYVYDATPKYVYVGYTPGYMGCYVYGPVVVYGTGYYYNPWYGPYYYPRPVTFGFSMHYNPYMGWSMGFHYSSGFFSFHYYSGVHPGYWGPPMYRPPYHPHYHGGMYGPKPPVYIGGDVNINVNNGNIYNKRNGVTSNDIKRSGSNNKPVNNLNNNNVLSDKQGNVYQRNNSGNWQQRNDNKWSPASNASTNDLNHQMNSRERSQNLNQGYNQNRKATPSPSRPNRK